MISIRRAQAEDVREIAELEEATSATAWSEDAICNDVCSNERAHVMVAIADSGVVGYADAWEIAGELQLNNIAVNKDYRRQHIAENLLEHIIADAENCKVMNLEVRKSNEAAIGLYKKLGFVVVGERPDYYEDNGEDAVLMDLEIR